MELSDGRRGLPERCGFGVMRTTGFFILFSFLTLMVGQPIWQLTHSREHSTHNQVSELSLMGAINGQVTKFKIRRLLRKVGVPVGLLTKRTETVSPLLASRFVFPEAVLVPSSRTQAPSLRPPSL